jgi:nucleotide-binding universal stress UspA family protein
LGDLARWALEIPSRVTPKLEVIAGYGRIDLHLEQLTRKLEADLLVIGSHQRNLSDHVWQSSVSRTILQEATCNVLCVPERFLPVRTGSVPRVVVVPTDFSPLSDRAIGVAASLLGLGGVLHIVHVANDAREGTRSAALVQLQARVPKDAPARRITSELRVFSGEQPWIEIWRHAERTLRGMVAEGVARFQERKRRG